MSCACPAAPEAASVGAAAGVQPTMTTLPVTKPATLPVLLIEDEPAVMAYVRAALERNGYSVVCSESGAERCDCWSQASFWAWFPTCARPAA